VVPDKATWEFIKGLTETRVWLGAIDERVEGEWVWVDGTKMTFKGVDARQSGQRQRQGTLSRRRPCQGGGWNDTMKEWDAYKQAPIVGYICEWKVR
jgi:hypothetical protein